MSVIGFSNISSIRLTDDQRKNIEWIVENRAEKYDSVSHYIRSAALRQMRKEIGEIKSEKKKKEVTGYVR